MPKTKLLNALTGLLVVAGLATPMSAADLPFSPGVKFRAGASAGNLHDDMNHNNVFGVSLTMDFKTWENAALFGELTYTTMDGNQQPRTFAPAIADGKAGAPGGTNLAGGKVFGDTSADLRKNSMDGFGLRAGYRAKLGMGWNWQGGLTLDMLKYVQQASGELRYLPVDAKSSNPASGDVQYRSEGIASTPHTSKLNVGAFAGIQRPFGDAFSVELNLVSTGYSSINYVPAVYSGGTVATTETKTRRGLVLELAVGMKF